MDLKERLTSLRRSRGYSLREMRERIKLETGETMAISYLSELERLGGTPSMEMLGRIAAGYGMSLQELLAPVDLAGGSGKSPYTPEFETFVKNRGLDPEEKEDLWRVVYRGGRPETEEDWELLYATVNAIDKRRSRR